MKVFFALFMISVALGILERLFPSIRGQQWIRRGYWLDLAYWFFTPLVTKAATRLGLAVAVGLIAVLIGVRLDDLKDRSYEGFGVLGGLPLVVQGLLVLFMADFIGYWTHRLFHGRALWKFHAVHHSSEEVDWLSSVRLHPLNDAANKLAITAPLFLLGFNPFAVAGAAPLLTLYALFLHANVNWTYGPFRHVIASPVFHRWHHTKEAEAMDKNFAGLFPVWDLLFGTYYMPKGKIPVEFGVNEPVPATLWGQLWYPFQKKLPDR